MTNMSETKSMFQNKLILFLITLLIITLVGYIHFLGGYELSFFLFYILPILFASRNLGFKLGLVICFVCGAVWLLVDQATGHVYSHPVIIYWNMGMRLATFLFILYLDSRLNEEISKEKIFSRTDSTTGIGNARYFHESLNAEFLRAKRSGRNFSLIYFVKDRTTWHFR
jgi:predicted signal transduction protein with EAL and GGDEF domain